MAQFIQGDGGVLAALVYGGPHPSATAFIQQNQSNNFGRLTEEGAGFIARGVAYMESLVDRNALSIARAALRMADNLWRGDQIRPLDSLAAIQNAPQNMMRFIMAEPTIRKRYHQQRCEGYGGMYVDYQPGVVGEDHHDYQVVTDGLFLPDPNTGELVATTYFSEQIFEDVELSLDEQIDIQQITWTEAKRLMAKGKEDPTSPYNANL